MADKDQSLNLNIFALNQIGKECHIPDVTLHFPTFNHTQSSLSCNLPCFNHDKSYFTPCFILPSDQKYYHENNNFQKYQFQEKIQRSMQQTMIIQSSSLQYQGKMATPNTNYCQVCSEKFNDYFLHCSLDSHLLKSTLASGTNMIKDLCLQVQGASKSCNSTKKPKKSIQQKERQYKKYSRKEKRVKDVFLNDNNNVLLSKNGRRKCARNGLVI